MFGDVRKGEGAKKKRLKKRIKFRKEAVGRSVGLPGGLELVFFLLATVQNYADRVAHVLRRY